MALSTYRPQVAAVGSSSSRKFWILLTKTKAEWYEAFIHWKLPLENEMQDKIASLYCDVDTVLTQCKTHYKPTAPTINVQHFGIKRNGLEF